MKQREHCVVRYFAFLITTFIFDNFYAGMLGLFGTASLRYLRCVVAASVCAGPDLVAALVFCDCRVYLAVRAVAYCLRVRRNAQIRT